MTTPDIDNINVTAFDPMPSPEEIHARLPLSASAAGLVMRARGAAQHPRPQGPAAVRRRRPVLDPRPGGRLDYARRLKALADEVGDTLYLVMRVYFEKPRTTTGWKGYINDPDMDDSFHVDQGMQKGPQFPARTRRTRAAGRHRGARPDRAAVSRRPDLVDGDRRAHHRIADAPRDIVRPVDAGRLQERHQRRCRHRRQRHPFRLAAAQLPRHQRPGAHVDRAHARQPLRPPRPARRRRPTELRHGQRADGRAGAASRPVAEPTSSSTARTPTATRSTSCSRWSWPTWSTRSASATSRWSA
jgi:hypothetical protein